MSELPRADYIKAGVFEGDLISREALKKHKFPINIADGVEIKEIEVVPVACIDNAPTVDIKDKIAGAYNEGYMCGNKEAEKARTQGEWLEGKYGTFKCNKCGCEIRYSYLIGNKPDFPNFCPDCGAKMQKGGSNG